MKKILTLLGDFYHNHDNMMLAFETALNGVSNNCEILDTTTENFAEDLFKNPDIVVIGAENRINPQDNDIKYWMTQKIEDEIVKYVENGGKLFVWHSGLASYPEEGVFVKLLKGYFKHHPDKNKPVKYTSVKSDILNQKDYSFEVLDEHYFVYCDVKNTEVFLHSFSEDGESIAGWAHRVGRGKVLALTPTHREEGLKNTEMINLLKDALNWLLSE